MVEKLEYKIFWPWLLSSLYLLGIWVFDLWVYWLLYFKADGLTDLVLTDIIVPSIIYISLAYLLAIRIFRSVKKVPKEYLLAFMLFPASLSMAIKCLQKEVFVMPAEAWALFSALTFFLALLAMYYCFKILPPQKIIISTKNILVHRHGSLRSILMAFPAFEIMLALWGGLFYAGVLISFNSDAHIIIRGIAVVSTLVSLAVIVFSLLKEDKLIFGTQYCMIKKAGIFKYKHYKVKREFMKMRLEPAQIDVFHQVAVYNLFVETGGGEKLLFKDLHTQDLAEIEDAIKQSGYSELLLAGFHSM